MRSSCSGARAALIEGTSGADGFGEQLFKKLEKEAGAQLMTFQSVCDVGSGNTVVTSNNIISHEKS